MKDEYERLLYVLEMCPSDKDKIDFLLRQVEVLIKANEAYREEIIRTRKA